MRLGFAAAACLALASCTYDWKIGSGSPDASVGDASVVDAPPASDRVAVRADCKVNCECTAGQECVFECTSQIACSMTCRAGSVCTMNCSNGAPCSATCDPNAECTLECNRHAGCTASCARGSKCVTNCNSDPCSTDCSGVCSGKCKPPLCQCNAADGGICQ